jgi:hypothetical protein
MNSDDYWYEANFGQYDDPNGENDQDVEGLILTKHQNGLKKFMQEYYGITWRDKFEFEDSMYLMTYLLMDELRSNRVKHFRTRAFITKNYCVNLSYWKTDDFFRLLIHMDEVLMSIKYIRRV